jgi:hypothetical protein
LFLLSVKEPSKGLYTEILDSLSQFPVDMRKFEIILSLVESLDKLLESDARGQFEWMDSVLVSALENGHWLLIDNVNLCSSSVLDRLNSVLETGGYLAINERGLFNGEIKKVTPHKDFRIFFAMDPRHGEISRAMRNRLVEICVTDFDPSSVSSRTSAILVASSLGLPVNALAKGAFKKIELGEISAADLRVCAAEISRGRLTFDLKAGFEMQTVSRSQGITATRNSILSNVRLEGVILHSLLNTGIYPWKSRYQQEVPLELLELAAFDIFAKRNSFASESIRKGWIRFLINSTNLISPTVRKHFDNVGETPSEILLEFRRSFLNEVGLSSLESELV